MKKRHFESAKNLAATKCAPLWQNMFLISEFKEKRTQTPRTWMNNWTSIPAATTAAASAVRRTCWFGLSTKHTNQLVKLRFLSSCFLFLSSLLYLLLSFAPEHSKAAHAAHSTNKFSHSNWIKYHWLFWMSYLKILILYWKPTTKD